MKYLKEYNHEFYTEIDMDEHYDLSTKRIPLSKSEIQMIMDIKEANDKLIHWDIFEGIKGIITFFSNKKDIDIYSISDEFYMVVFRNCKGTKPAGNISYYKCDQLEGIKKLLMDNYEIY